MAIDSKTATACLVTSEIGRTDQSATNHKCIVKEQTTATRFYHNIMDGFIRQGCQQ